MTTHLTHTFRNVGGIRLAEDLDTLSRDEIDAVQRHNLWATLRAAYESTNVWRSFPGLAATDTVDDFASLPLLSAADVAAGCPPHSTDLLFDSSPGLVLRSSGTASRPKVLYHSWDFTDRVGHLGVRGVRAALQTPPSRVANCLWPGDLNGAFLFVQDITRSLPALSFAMGELTATADAAAVISAHGIDTLVASPAYGTEVVAGRPDLPLRNFLFIGESLGTERERVVRSAAPDLTVRSLAYSTSETGPIGYQCRHQSGSVHHIHEDAIVLEVVDETGRPVPAGTPGELVVTPLTTSGMALFRYRLGDRGQLVSDGCPCGSSARSVKLLGRMPNSMTVDTITFSSDHLLAALAGLGVDQPNDCQFQVLWEDHRYRVRLLLSPATPDDITTEATLAALRHAHEIHEIIVNPRCVAFEVQRVAIDQFARTQRGKVPVLYQHGITG
ncbi:phenylacetate--CoA ligase family protein [Mycolicibacterium sp. P1-5]|uniref:phenylacetate--CoA ligase family protein n=1 Tax=Mycolicibacterium sp. P1-5 TaxID=2024617 RepID=UPI0011EC849E|nr:AMP-binding protein [Mycolicibacterium sp. P1-5]KAA0110631.1 phenylacetate--CoA ligase family protein [Mycolicibacterium sp. P1-5]